MESIPKYPFIIEHMPKKVQRVIGKPHPNAMPAYSLLRKQNFGSHNMKTFEIPAMNGLLLTRRNTEQNTLFEENVFCYMYKDYKELRKKIKDILTDSAKANIIRKAAHNKVRQFSYENRLKFLLSNLL